MREFGPPVSENLRRQVLEEVARLVADYPSAGQVLAEDYVLEPPQEVVLDHAAITMPDGVVDLNLVRPGWAPPFEWLAEITSSLPGDGYLKHYLVRESDIVLAHRRELTPVDDEEARLILADLQVAAANLA